MTSPRVRFELNLEYPTFAAQIAKGVPASKLAYPLVRNKENETLFMSQQMTGIDQRAFSSQGIIWLSGARAASVDAASFLSTTQAFRNRIAEDVSRGLLFVYWQQDEDLTWTPDPGSLTPLVYPSVAYLEDDIRAGHSPWVTRTKTETADDPVPTSLNDLAQVPIGFILPNYRRALLKLSFFTSGGNNVTDGVANATVWFKAQTSGAPSWWTGWPQTPPAAFAFGDVFEISDTLGKEFFVQITGASGTSLDHINIEAQGIAG